MGFGLKAFKCFVSREILLGNGLGDRGNGGSMLYRNTLEDG